MIFDDVRHALRQFAKAPGFALTAVVSLALGIGANTAIFSVVNAVLRHPAGVDRPGSVAVMSVRYAQFNLDVPVVSVPDLADAASLKDVEAGALERDASYNTVRGDQAQHLAAAQVSWRWFQVFGAHPILGRSFAPEEDEPGGAAVAVINYGLWQSNFGGQRDAIGKTLLLDQKPYRVIGVMRSDFDWPRAKQLWTPLALAPDAYSSKSRFRENYQALVRLRPGVTLARFNAALARKMQTTLRSEGAGAFAQSAGWSVYSAHLTDQAAGPLRKALYVLFAVVALVLLIAAANVAGLFLARASARSKEFAIRMALGASGARMMAQSMVEALLLAGVATAIGITAGPVLGRLLLSVVPNSLAEGFDVQMEPSVLAFTAAAGLLTSLIAGVGPVLKMLAQRGRLNLHETGRSNTASAERQRLRGAFVVGEVALAFVLLTGTGLFLVSLSQLEHVNPGFNPQGLVAAELSLSGEAYKNNAARQVAFVNAVVESLSARPGVTAAAALDRLPFADKGNASSFEIEGRPSGKDDPGPHSQLGSATVDLLQVMRIPLLAGRWFTTGDRATTQPVVVVDARLAHRYWPTESPLGKHLRDGSEPWSTVVGVVGNIRFSSLEDDTSDGMRYYSYAQASRPTANFLVRTNGELARMAGAMKQAVAAADPTQTLTDVTLMDTLVSRSLAGRQLIVWMLAAFAGLALLLAIIGIYGLISYVTVQRTAEVGLRMALGALRRDVIAMVLMNASRWIVMGSCIGVMLSVAITTLLEHFFANFGAGEAASLGTAMLTLLAFGALAGLIPALRAASVNPIQALRNE